MSREEVQSLLVFRERREIDDLCGNCGAEASTLCDQPLEMARGQKVGLGAPLPTCSAPLCEGCRTQVGATFGCGAEGFLDSVDLCPFHAPPPKLNA